MNGYSTENQEKVLEILIKLQDNSPLPYIFRPTKFEENFPFVEPETLVGILDILQSKELIKVAYASFEDSFNIYTLKVLPKGLDYFNQKQQYEKNNQAPNITIENSSNFNIGNNNTLIVNTGITPEEAIGLIEQSTLADKEALKEFISLFNDLIENNKPIEPSTFQKVLAGITSVVPLIQTIGGIVLKKIGG